MNLREQIGLIVSELPGVPNFVYGRKSEINISGDNAQFPAVVLIEPDQMGFNLDATTGGLKDTYNVFIQFIDQIEMGEDANYRHPVVEDMRTLAGTFIRRLSAADIFKDLNVNIPGILVVDTYDVNVAGIEINLAQLTDIYNRPC